MQLMLSDPEPNGPVLLHILFQVVSGEVFVGVAPDSESVW